MKISTLILLIILMNYNCDANIRCKFCEDCDNNAGTIEKCSAKNSSCITLKVKSTTNKLCGDFGSMTYDNFCIMQHDSTANCYCSTDKCNENVDPVLKLPSKEIKCWNCNSKEDSWCGESVTPPSSVNLDNYLCTVNTTKGVCSYIFDLENPSKPKINRMCANSTFGGCQFVSNQKGACYCNSEKCNKEKPSPTSSNRSSGKLDFFLPLIILLACIPINL